MGADRETWVHARGVVSLARTRVMGIVNLTPDSFYDGGRLTDRDEEVDVGLAESYCRHLSAQGAAILDIGGESTQPGARPVDRALEIRRVVPLIERVSAWSPVPISVDTRHAVVARAALEAGAAIVNDVSGLADPAMTDVVAASGAGLVIGHMRGIPETMQEHVHFEDLLGELAHELGIAVEAAIAGGIERARIVVDPGIGFGKTHAQSAALVGASRWLAEATGCPVLIGASRKRFIAALGKRDHDDAPVVSERLPGSLAAAVVAAIHGAAIVRVHDVRETVQALAVATAITESFARARARHRAGGHGEERWP